MVSSTVITELTGSEPHEYGIFTAFIFDIVVAPSYQNTDLSFNTGMKDLQIRQGWSLSSCALCFKELRRQKKSRHPFELKLPKDYPKGSFGVPSFQTIILWGIYAKKFYHVIYPTPTPRKKIRAPAPRRFHPYRSFRVTSFTGTLGIIASHRLPGDLGGWDGPWLVVQLRPVDPC